MTYRKMNDWRGYPVDGWVAGVPDVKPAAADGILTHRALVLDADAPIDRRIDAAFAMARDADGGQLLIQLAAENQLASTLREAAGAVIFTNPDRGVRDNRGRTVSAPGRTISDDRCRCHRVAPAMPRAGRRGSPRAARRVIAWEPQGSRSGRSSPISPGNSIDRASSSRS